MTAKTIAELFDLSGKSAIITGGGMGIGKAIALRLVEAGAAAVIADIDNEAAEHTVKEIEESGGQAVAVRADARQASDAARVMEVAASLGGPDILVNNAGIYPMMPVLNISEDLWDRVLDTNLKGAFLYSQAAARAMIESGHGGNIINLASIDAFKPNGSVAHYNASKGGLLMLTKALALELAPHGIRVNAVAPGGVVTPGTEAIRQGLSQSMGVPEEAILQGYAARVPLGRMGEPDDVAKVVLFLASGAAEYVTGETIVIDGGYLLS